MKRPDVTPIGKSHAENHHDEVAGRDEDTDGRLVETLHFEHGGDQVGLDGYHSHGDGVVKDDDAALSLCRHQAHPEDANHLIADAQVCHRPREHAEEGNFHGDHRNGNQNQALG